MPENEKRVAAEGPAKPESAGRVFGKIGDAIGGVVGDVLDPPSLRDKNPAVPPAALERPGPDTLAPDKAVANDQLAEQERRRKEISEFDVTGQGGIQQFPTRPRSVNDALNAQAGGAKPLQTGTKSRSVQKPNAPREEFDKLNQAHDFEARALSAQQEARAAGYGLQMNIYEDLKLGQQEEVFPILQAVQGIFDDADRQLQGIQELEDDVRANRINPGQFFANIGDAGAFASAMAVAAGHLASAMGGGPNTALSVINGAIQRNMRAQALNQAHDRAILNANIQIFDRMRALGVDRLNQANVYNSLLLSQAQSSLESINAATSSVEARAQIGVIQAQLAAQKQENIIRFHGAVTATTQMKLFAAQSAAQKSAKADTRAGAIQTVMESAGQPVAERLSKLIEYQVGTGSSISDVDIANIQAADPAFKGIPTAHFKVPSDGEPLKFRDAVTGEEAELRPNQRFLDLEKTGPNSKEAIRQKMEAQHAFATNWKRIYELASEIQSTPGQTGFKGLLAADKGSIKVLGGSESDERIQELVNRANRAVVLQSIAESGRMEAIRGPGEWEVLMKKTQLPSTPQSFVNLLTKDGASDLFYPGVKTVLQETKRDLDKYTQ